MPELFRGQDKYPSQAGNVTMGIPMQQNRVAVVAYQPRDLRQESIEQIDLQDQSF
jgi:hypothetical protein